MGTLFLIPLVGDLSAENRAKSAHLAKIVIFGTQIVTVITVLFKNFDGSNFVGHFHGRHLEHIFLNISKTKTARKFISVARPPFSGSMSPVDKV